MNMHNTLSSFLYNLKRENSKQEPNSIHSYINSTKPMPLRALIYTAQVLFKRYLHGRIKTAFFHSHVDFYRFVHLVLVTWKVW